MKKFKILNKFSSFIFGKILFIKYLLIKNDEIKIINFIGLCTYYKKKNGSFAVKNIIKNESISIILNTCSPILQTILHVNRYKKKIKLKKLK
jgi:ribosomal protein L19